MKNIHDLPGNGFVNIKARHHKDQMRTFTQGSFRRHGRTHSIATGFVAGSCHHTACSRITHGQRLPLVLREIPLLNRSKEGIHVDMYYFAHEVQK